MIRLSAWQPPDLVDLRRALALAATGCSTMESVGKQLMDILYRELQGENPADPQVALVRCFVTCPYSTLSTQGDLQERARKLLGDTEPNPSHRCLVLLGTRGMEPAWDQRQLSTGHQVIPLGSPGLMQKTPMITELCRQIGITRTAFLNPGQPHRLDLALRRAGCFHIAEAAGSPFIPAQSDFVHRYRVRSVLGLGAPLDEQDFFAVLLFARVPLSAELAAAMKPLTVSIKLALSVLRHRLFVAS